MTTPSHGAQIMVVSGEAIALASAAIWGTGILMYKVSLRELSPLELTFIRSISASVFLVLTAFAFRSTPFEGLGIEALMLIVLSGILLVLGDILYFRCVGSIGIWIATPLSSVYPLFVTAIALTFLHESVTGLQLIGIGLIVLGVAVLTFRTPPGEGSEGGKPLRYSLYGLLAALLWATSLVALRYVIIEGGLFTATSSRSIFIVLFLGLSLGLKGRLGDLRRRRFSRSVRYLSFISGAWGIGFGGLLFFYSMDFIGTARATAISATYPLFAGFLGTLLLGERVTIHKVTGAVLVVSGLAFLP